MKQKKGIIILVLLVLTTTIGMTQRKSGLDINVGDTIPDITINNIINYQRESIRLSDFKGKLVILDFWATWCSPCLAAFPKLDSLQKKFQNDVQILPVTYEDPELVSGFLRRLSKVSRVLPVSITGDKILNRYFKHTFLPHYVWIDGSSRRVLAITEGKDVTESNINAFKKSRPMSFALKKDENRRIKDENALFMPTIQVVKEDNTAELIRMTDSTVVLRSALTKYVEGLPPGLSFGDSTYLSLRNITIWRLYQIALLGNSLAVLSQGSVKTEIQDSALFNHVMGLASNGKRLSPGLETLSWLRENGYCYELKVPPSMASQKNDIMLGELNRYFGSLLGLEGKIVKRSNKVLALIRTTQDERFASKGGSNQVLVDKLSLKVQNEDFASVIANLSIPLQRHPQIIDETGYVGKIDLDLKCVLADLNELNKELDKYGLKLIEKEIFMDVPVIFQK